MIGWPRAHHRVTDSTNAQARALAAAGAPHGTVVTADEQTAGRGRQGRTWSAGPGEALLMSAVVRGVGPGTALLPLGTALAVCEAVEALGVPEARIKWPNDVWVEGRKVSGILLEGRPQEGWAVIGVGLNVRTREFPEELRETATSLALAGVEATAEEALAELVPALSHWSAAPAADVIEAWRPRDALRGQMVRWAGGEGVATGIDETGALIVDTGADEPVALDAGEVHLLR